MACLPFSFTICSGSPCLPSQEQVRLQPCKMSITTFNAMMETFVDQLNDQYIAWLFKVNEGSFPNLSAKPKVIATKVRKNVDLDQLTSFLEFYADRYDLSEGDLINIRTQTEILKEELPMDEDIVPVKEGASPDGNSDQDNDDDIDTDSDDEDEDEAGDSDLSMIRDDVVEAIHKEPGFIRRLLEKVKVK